MYEQPELMSRLRDLALNRLFFPPPNVFMTAANLITHFDQTAELVAKRIFQEPFTEDEIREHKVMPDLGEQEVGWWMGDIHVSILACVYFLEPTSGVKTNQIPSLFT